VVSVTKGDVFLDGVGKGVGTRSSVAVKPTKSVITGVKAFIAVGVVVSFNKRRVNNFDRLTAVGES
jgi:hypothetical protein